MLKIKGNQVILVRKKISKLKLSVKNAQYLRKVWWFYEKTKIK